MAISCGSRAHLEKESVAQVTVSLSLSPHLYLVLKCDLNPISYPDEEERMLMQGVNKL